MQAVYVLNQDPLEFVAGEIASLVPHPLRDDADRHTVEHVQLQRFLFGVIQRAHIQRFPQDLRIPLQGVDIEQHGTGGVGVIGYMDFSSGEYGRFNQYDQNRLINQMMKY